VKIGQGTRVEGRVETGAVKVFSFVLFAHRYGIAFRHG
jgi:hypothetical protein